MEKSDEEENSKENTSLRTADGVVKEETSIKGRKPFEWTEKRKAGFEKMRVALKEKNEITKQLKEEKRILEKEEIKRRVREIMNQTLKPAEDKKVKKSKRRNESESESSEEEVVKPSRRKEKSKAVEVEKKKSSKRAIKEASSSDESSEDDDSESEESVEERVVLNKKQYDRYSKDKRNGGKVAKQSAYVNALDQFILL